MFTPGVHQGLVKRTRDLFDFNAVQLAEIFCGRVPQGCVHRKLKGHKPIEEAVGPRPNRRDPTPEFLLPVTFFSREHGRDDSRGLTTGATTMLDQDAAFLPLERIEFQPSLDFIVRHFLVADGSRDGTQGRISSCH